MADFMTAVNIVLKNEGGLINSPNDPGGITNFGISLRWYKGTISQNATSDDIINLTEENAITLYKKYFWDNQLYENIYDQWIANMIFDMSVNMGASISHKLVQRALWTMIKQNNPVDDGILGNITLNLINDNNTHKELCLPLLAERAGHYRLIAATEPFAKDNLVGWLNRTYNKIYFI